MIAPSISIVLASIDSKATIEPSVQGFLDELDGRGRVIVVDASKDDSARLVSEDVTLVRRDVGRLAPELWGDGLSLVDTDLVAFSTTQMVPRFGWLNGLLERLESSGASGVGGPIAPSRGLSSIDKALYLLRYANYLPPVPDSSSFDPPGDNALYRCKDLARVGASWASGFWEVEVHSALRALGKTLSMDPESAVEYRGGCRFGKAVHHRFRHARRYGACRSAGLGIASRAARAMASPIVPPLLLARIVRNLRSRNEPLGRWLPALPHLGALLATWSMGEVCGTLAGAVRCRPIDADFESRSEALATSAASS